MRWFTVALLCLLPNAAEAQHGVFFDYHNPTATNPAHINHPHVDGVFLRFAWSDLESEKGVYNFDAVETMIRPWVAAGRRVILGVKPAGQHNQNTPDWVYENVPAIEYFRKGVNVRIPRYWDENYPALYGGLIKQLGRRYDNDDRIEAVMVGVAHLGFITACPNKGGSIAFMEAGWTPDRWRQHVLRTIRKYKRHFTNKPLFVQGSELILKVPKPGDFGFPESQRYFAELRDLIFTRAVNRYTIGVAGNGLSADRSEFMATGIPALFHSFSEPATTGIVALAVHDDWPLWVPADRRQGVNGGKDNAYFISCLQNAIGGVGAIPNTNVAWIKMLDSDLSCTNPTHANYQPECESALVAFKAELLK